MRDGKNHRKPTIPLGDRPLHVLIAPSELISTPHFVMSFLATGSFSRL